MRTSRSPFAVHFKNQDVCPGLKRGGALNIAFHEIEVLVAADHIPEEIVVDLAGKNIGDSIHIADLKLPKGAKATGDGAVVVATVTGTSAQDVRPKTRRPMRPWRKSSTPNPRPSLRPRPPRRTRKTPPKADPQRARAGLEPC